MKKYSFLIFTACLTAGSVYAQSPLIEKFLEKNRTAIDVSVVSLSQEMLRDIFERESKSIARKPVSTSKPQSAPARESSQSAASSFLGKPLLHISDSTEYAILVDGVESTLSRLNPEDIISIEVVKDEISTDKVSITTGNGENQQRAAYKVISITTRNGENQQRAEFYPENYGSVSIPGPNVSAHYETFRKILIDSKFEPYMEMVNGVSKTAIASFQKKNGVYNEIYVVRSQPFVFSILFLKGRIDIENTDYYLSIIRQNLHNHTVGMSSQNFSFSPLIASEWKESVEKAKKQMEQYRLQMREVVKEYRK
ncbi:MAG: hypothetical protein LBS09_04690 [Bacteroidales bacterium]|jgi:hypothetical protein|nr:hypothetical protein [Bacteroidales bacterium]